MGGLDTRICRSVNFPRTSSRKLAQDMPGQGDYAEAKIEDSEGKDRRCPDFE